MRSRRLRDGANTQVLETVVIASIMVSAVAFVATFESAPPGSSPSRDMLQQQAQDALSILYDTPVSGSTFGTNALSVYVQECLQDNCDNLTARLDRLLPRGSSYALYISNGHSTFPVLVSREPAGEAVTATQLLEPKWSNTFVASAMDTVNPLQDSLLLYTLPIFNSQVLSPGGNPLMVLVHATNMDDGSDYTLTAYTSTHAWDATDVTRAPATSLFFKDSLDAPIATMNVAATTVSGGSPTGTPVTFTLRVEESANVPIPAGTTVTVSLPRGWTGSASSETNGAAWKVLSNATARDGGFAGGDIRASLNSALANGGVDFEFEATYHGDKVEFYSIHAALSRGAHSSATLLVRADDRDQPSPFEFPTLYLNAPRPMGALAETTWTLGATLPERDGKPWTRALMADRIEIVEMNGMPIFGNVSHLPADLNLPPSLHAGTWVAQGDRLVWEGERFFGRNLPLDIAFAVTASGVGASGDTRAPFAPPVSFDSGTGRILTQSAPGLYRGSFLPADGDKGYIGYLTPGAGHAQQTETIRSDVTYRGTPLPGSTQVVSGLTNPIHDAIYGSYVHVERRNVPVGGQVVLTTDVQSMLFALAELGNSAGVTVNFYPPWTGDERTPIWSSTSLDAGFLSSDVTQIVLHDLNGDGFPDPIVGTSNGRVFGLHALTGARFEGDVYSAPLRDNVVDLTSAASVQHMSLLEVGGETYIVVGTDALSTGLIVLDTSFEPVWTFDLNGRDVIGLTSDTDMTGDGRNDIVAAVTVRDASVIYVLEAHAGNTTLTPFRSAAPIAELIPLVDGIPVLSGADVSDIDDAFYVSPGKASALVALPAENGFGPSLAVTLQTIADVDVYLNIDLANPKAPAQVVYSTPRVGLQGVDTTGAATYTFFGSPITTGQPYDYDGTGARDIVAGGPAGFVFMLNGTQATQPLYSLVLVGAPSIIDADSRTPFESYILTGDGSIYYTDDAWASTYCINCDPVTEINAPIPTARAIGVNATASLWLVGSYNTLYQSIEGDHADQSTEALAQYHIAFAGAPSVKPVIMVPTNLAGLDVTKLNTVSLTRDVYSLTDVLHDFADVHFQKGALADHGWVLGSACEPSAMTNDVLTAILAQNFAALTAEQSCAMPFLMRTTDGGASWTVATAQDPTHRMIDHEGNAVTAELNRIRFNDDTIGWIVGASGTVLRTTDGGTTWTGLTPPGAANLRDIACPTSARCIVVGDNGAAYATDNANGPAASVTWTELGVAATVGAKSLHTVGFHDVETGYIGTQNAVLKTYDGGATWTTLPLNYVENDGRIINIFPDGSGYVYGGGPGNGRIWFLADYATEGVATTTSLTPQLPEGARITQVETLRTNLSASSGATEILAFATPNASSDWYYFAPDLDNTNGRNLSFEPITFWGDSGKDLRLRFELHVNGDKTLYTPTVRDFDLIVHYELNGVAATLPVSVDFSSHDQLDAAATTAWWNTEIGALHSAIVQEYWVRNVSGEVLDIRSGFDLQGDGRDEIWVATGGVLSLNSPDYNIYAGLDKTMVLHPDNRVYLLDGSNGTILKQSESLPGKVAHLRLFDADNDGTPDHLYAATQPSDGASGTVALLDPITLEIIWQTNVAAPVNDLELGLSQGNAPAAFAATASGLGGVLEGGGRIWSLNATDGGLNWKVLPDDKGRYTITAPIPDNWFFGPYVVEVSVSWEQALSGADPVLRAARVYDYFMVTPPDSLSPPSPIYDVHLVAWFDDWR